MKKMIAWLLVLTLTAAASIGATIAYMTASDEDVNVMTLGKVRIDQLEYERIDSETKDEDAKVQEFHNDKPLYPGVYEDDFDWGTDDAYVDWEQIGKDDYPSGIWNPDEINNEQDKMVFVKNKGDYDAYVRTVFGFEGLPGWTLKDFQENIHLNLNDEDWTWEWVQVPVTVGGGTYFIATATYNYPLAPGQITEISLSQIALDKSVTNEVSKAFGDTYQVLAKSQAVQSDGFTDPKTALDTAFGPIDAQHVPFENDNPTLGTDLRTALHYLDGDGVTWIADDIDLVVFGNINDYYDIAMSNDGTLVDAEQEVEVKSYYVQDKNGRYTVYFLASDTIYTPKDCSELFANMNYLTTVVTENMSTKKTENMYKMFYSCHSLTNMDVHHWDTSNVTDMSFMFTYCTYLKYLDLTSWDVGNVTTMKAMFYMDSTDYFGAHSELTGIDVTDWDVSNVTDISHMFRGCTSLKTLDLSSWDVSNVTTMQRTFSDCYDLTGIGIESWNTSSLVSLRDTFVNCRSIPSLDLSAWDVSKVTDLQGTFTSLETCTSLNLTGWDTSNVTRLYQTFWNCLSITTVEGISDWDTSNVTTMRGLFAMCGRTPKDFRIDLSKWDTSNVTNMQYMFYRCNLTQLDGISNFDLSAGPSLYCMFYQCSTVTELDFGGWDTSNITDMSHMLRECTNLKTVYVGDKWTTENVTASSGMFYRDYALVGGNGFAFNGTHNKTYARVDTPAVTDSEGNVITEAIPGYLTHVSDKPTTETEG